MTYTEAAAHNKQYSLYRAFRDPKQLANGANLRWVKDPEGKIGYVRGSCASDNTFLVLYPMKVLKAKVDLAVCVWPSEYWDQFELL